jgi:hypothetical protein
VCLIDALIDASVYGQEHQDRNDARRQMAMKLAIIALPFAIFNTLVPDKEEIAILVGAHYGMELAKSPEGVKAWTLIRGKANEILDAELKKLEPQK